MTVNRESLEKLGRFLLRGLRIGAAGGWIQLPAELPLRQQTDHQLPGGAHQ
jgi:hypothetical protein